MSTSAMRVVAMPAGCPAADFTDSVIASEAAPTMTGEYSQTSSSLMLRTPSFMYEPPVGTR